MKRLFLIALVTSFLGCASGPVYQPEAPTADQALVYIYREAATPLWMRTAVISIDGEKIGELPNGGYLVAHLSPGAHSIMQTWSSWGAGDDSALKTAQAVLVISYAGQSQYVQFLLTKRSEFPYEIIEWRLQQVSAEIGSMGIAECKKQQAGP